MAEPREVIGIFLERSRGVLLRAVASKRENVGGSWTLEFIDGKPLYWDSTNPEEAKANVRHFAEIAWAHRDRCKSIAVACYGPFNSLNLADGAEYGTLSKDTAHLPFCGVSLPELFSEVLDRTWMQRPDTRFSVHTDASASALGEAIARSTGNDTIVAHLTVAEGVGLGMVRGRDILQSALHPEIGLMPVQPRANDPLVDLRKGLPLYTLSLAEFTDNKSLRDRYERMPGRKNPSLSDIMSIDDEGYWDMRAFYLAQACLACLVVNPPHKIIIGATIDPLGDVADRTRTFFKKIMEKRADNGQPVIDYPALRGQYIDFIAAPKPVPRLDAPHELATTGAAGMCYAAADALSRAKVIDIRTHRR